MSELRWGVVGVGGIARTFVAEVSHLDGMSVTAVAARRAERAEAAAQHLGVTTAHTDVAALADDPDVDIVYVASPHPSHAEHALTAIAAGKHVLVEKPFTMDAAQARQVADAARAAGVFCMEAMWTRFLPAADRVRAAVTSGALGEVRSVVADHGQTFPRDPDHRLFSRELGGGAMLDLGIYPLSWAVMVLGLPSSVHAVADPAMTGVDAQTTVVLRYPNGAHALLHCTLEARTPTRACATGTLAHLEMDPPFYHHTGYTVRDRDGIREQYRAAPLTGPGKGMRFEALEAAGCIWEGLTESPRLPLEESVAIMGIIDEVHRQVGRPAD